MLGKPTTYNEDGEKYFLIIYKLFIYLLQNVLMAKNED